MTNARENDFFRRGHYLRSIRHFVLSAKLIKRVLDRAQVPRPVIDDGGHSRPFVEGS